jgi:hypothetical protein
LGELTVGDDREMINVRDRSTHRFGIKIVKGISLGECSVSAFEGKEWFEFDVESFEQKLASLKKEMFVSKPIQSTSRK